MKSSLVLILAIIIFWGLWGFLAKLAVQRVGIQASFWGTLTLFTSISIFLLFSEQLLPIKINAGGILLAISAGLVSSLASILFYILLGRNPVGFLVAVTALYPLVTIILSVIFLQEDITITKTIGFILAVGALLLLNL